MAAVLSLGLLLTSFSFSEAPDLRDGLQDLLATRAVSGLPAVEAQAPPVAETAAPPPSTPASDSNPLPEITVHPPGSTAEGALAVGGDAQLFAQHAGVHLPGLNAGPAAIPMFQDGSPVVGLIEGTSALWPVLLRE